MSDVKLGLGRATGMFYHAPAGTALPTDPTAELASAWTHVGDVSDAGITLTLNKTTENIKNWANVVKRVIMTEHSETVQAPIMDTTAESLETVVGSGNVTTASGVTTVNLSDGALPPEEAFLWVMKDGDDTLMLGTTSGFITALDDIVFAPGSVITWNATVSADAWTFMKDDGQVVTSP